MATAPHAFDWFEIPVRDLDRAQTFYETMLGTTLRRETIGPNRIAVFSYGEQAVGGCLIAGSGLEPAASGTLVYLGADVSLDAALARATAAGASPRHAPTCPATWAHSRTSSTAKAIASACMHRVEWAAGTMNAV